MRFVFSRRCAVIRRCAMAGLAVAVALSFISAALAQNGMSSRQPNPDGPPSGPAQARPGSRMPQQSQQQAQQPQAPKQLNPADQTIKDAFEKSKTAAALADYTAIIDECQSGLEQGAKSDAAMYAKKLQAWAHMKRGEKLAEQRDTNASLADFEAAIKLDPKLAKAFHNRGVSRAELGDTKGAMSDFSEVVRLNPAFDKAWYNRGELKYEQGDFLNALADYNKAIELQPRDGGYFNSRGHTNYRLGRLREALSDYNRSVQIDPNNAAALVNRGDAYREQAIYGPAASDYKDAIKIDPRLGRAYLSASWLMATCPDQRYRDPDRAVSAAQKAVELDGDKDYRYLDTLAAALASAGRFDEAKATAEKAAKRAPVKEAASIRKRMELYTEGRAFREGGPAEMVRPASATQ
jgi:tetratricopeptide (TPR) repeat protein